MINNIIKIYDNIGAKFTIENSDILIGVCINGFKTLSNEHVNSFIPYLLKNKEVWETGIGLVKSLDDKIYVERIKVIRSSNNDSLVDFSSLNINDNNFYIFANEYIFNTGLNHALKVDNDRIIDNVKATYLIDISNNSINLTLPPASDNPNLILDFKTNDGSHFCRLVETSTNYYLVIPNNTYVSIISDGTNWIELINISQYSNLSASSLSYSSSETSSFSSLNLTPNGASGSLQYNNGGLLAEAPIYVGDNKKLLLGSTSEDTAYSIIPTSGNYNTIFNNNKTASDFIVRGSGDKNLFFAYDGKLGLNIPSGARPLTALHLLNNSCQEGIRLENRNQCYPANITLYHKPNGALTVNAVIGTLNLSAKNSTNNQVDYVQLLARANSFTASATKGEFAIKLENNGLKIEPLKINSSGTFISNSLYVESLKYSISVPSGHVLTTDNNGNISPRPFNSFNTNITSIIYTGVVSSGHLLTANDSGGIELRSLDTFNPNLSTIRYSGTIPSGYVLIGNGNGNIILTDVRNTPIMNILDEPIVTFTGICS